MKKKNAYTNQSWSSQDLRCILHSKRANIYYLEYCRVMQKDGRVLYLTEEHKSNQYYNIPIGNTTVILLGNGTSITQAAVRLLSQAGVQVGFCGGGGTPLFAGTDICWMQPQSEYRPTEFIQNWLAWWWDEEKRLEKAKQLQIARVNFLIRVWTEDPVFKACGLITSDVLTDISRFSDELNHQPSITRLLQLEARVTRYLYRHAAKTFDIDNFKRDRDSSDTANTFLNHGNYLAYGLGATVAWVLGIPHSFAVLHGKTRRGALVFDIADLIKDALILPLAFICAAEDDSEKIFRQQCLNYFAHYHALDYQFNVVQKLAGGEEL